MMLDHFIEALTFAAERHVFQRRKGCDKVPYINHPLKVVYVVNHIGKINDPEILVAAVLHDVLEDTQTSADELKERFGERITNLVVELTDDMSLSYEDRKREQIKHAFLLSKDAKLIKMADKIANIRDILEISPNWSKRRKLQYVEWSCQVIKSCGMVSSELENAFWDIVKEAKSKI